MPGHHAILALDIAGNPFAWLSPQEAVHYYAVNKVAWELGDEAMLFRGGYSKGGVQSLLEIKPIIAVAGSEIMAKMLKPLPLGDNNDLLFKRDHYTCAFCAQRFQRHQLSRDHVVPRSRGGADSWTNCVTACRKCNGEKGSRLVANFRPLVYVPYAVCRFEHFLLSGRHVLADQHDYLAASLPKHSRML